jgi:diguanylate cyclase (GGDEF)-like protein
MKLVGKMEEWQRYGWPFGLLFIGIDNLDKTNEVYGSDIGDYVLKMVAKTLATSTRMLDLIGRWNDDQFLVVLVNVNESQIFSIANRFRFLVEQSSFTADDAMLSKNLLTGAGLNIIKATISIGARIPLPKESVEDLLAISEKRLNISKHSGGNRVTTIGGD